MLYLYYENGIEEPYTIETLKIYYEKEIDKLDYPDFECWMRDMIKLGIFIEKD